ncbi:MAG: 3-deoxy-8-phosphooctulonate synthase [Candidatus Kapaibacterium sp.]
MNVVQPDKNRLTVIAGPCVVESQQMLHDIAGTLKELTTELDVDFVFKASYRKANRTSASSFTGLGDDVALGFLSEIRTTYSVPVLTDIHETREVADVALVADVLQIPAFLCRQTELLVAAGESGRTVNIKKGQFAAPDDMVKAVDKVRSTGNDRVWVCERGTSFGYHDLVVDMRSLVIMRQTGCPVIFDATHSVQKPSAGTTSGGTPEFVPALTRAAVAAGVDGLFFETHPDPASALSDAATQLPLASVRDYLFRTVELDRFVRSRSIV